MLDKLFGGDRYLAQTRSLDAASMRHQVIANNLANANTPGFKRQEVQFEDQLASALDSSTGAFGTSGMSNVRPTVQTIGDTTSRKDGNNVTLELEASKMAENSLRYEVMTQSISGYFSGLKSAINGGR